MTLTIMIAKQPFCSPSHFMMHHHTTFRYKRFNPKAKTVQTDDWNFEPCDHNHSNPLFSWCSSLWWSSIKLSLATKRIISSEGIETYCDYISPHCDFDLEDSNPVYTAWYSTSWWCTTIHRYCPDKTWTGRCTGGIQDASKFLNLAYHPPPQAHLQPPPLLPPPPKKKEGAGRGGSWETELSPSKTEDLLCQMGFSSSWKQTKSTP